MRERPILFSGEMVRAILDGRKTQTRRVVTVRRGKRRILPHPPWEIEEDGKLYFVDEYGDDFPAEDFCPYGVPGDRLWVRETWTQSRVADKSYPHISPPSDHNAKDPVYWRASYQGSCQGVIWKPSIHMPRWASRITLEVKGVRVERLHGISEDDAIAEGVCANPYYMADGTIDELMSIPAVENFRRLWINCGYDWGRNPWVWVVEFEVAK